MVVGWIVLCVALILTCGPAIGILACELNAARREITGLRSLNAIYHEKLNDWTCANCDRPVDYDCEACAAERAKALDKAN
jgi:hypothetical protein